MKAQRILIKGGNVLTLDADRSEMARADVLIEGQLIQAIAPAIDAADSTIVDASGMIVMPGFVDAHRHTWQAVLKHIAPDADLTAYIGTLLGTFAPAYRPEDVYIGTLVGALEALDAGITTLFDWSHIQHTPEHTDAAVGALKEAGLRAIFGYGYPTSGPQWFYESALPHPADAQRVRREHFASNDQLVTMALAARGPELASMEVTRQDWTLARELGLHLSVHVGNGTFGVPYQAIEQLDAAGLLGPDTQYVHTVSLTDAALARIRDSGGVAVVTPAVEMQMGFGMPASGRLIAQGIRPG
jgi:5-methylthioadenosine/S-adenosylhomocysteine deaminase